MCPLKEAATTRRSQTSPVYSTKNKGCHLNSTHLMQELLGMRYRHLPHLPRNYQVISTNLPINAFEFS